MISKKNKKIIPFKLKDAEAYYFRGMSYADAGNTDQAIEDYTRAIELDPRNASA